MKNLQQFSAKVQYVTPSCRSVLLEASASMMNVTSPYGDAGRAGGIWTGDTYDLDEEE